MKATILDLRYHMKNVLQALDRNETVKILYHGKERGFLIPSGKPLHNAGKIHQHAAFGMWKKHTDKKNISAYLRTLRKPRFHAF